MFEITEGQPCKSNCILRSEVTTVTRAVKAIRAHVKASWLSLWPPVSRVLDRLYPDVHLSSVFQPCILRMLVSMGGIALMHSVERLKSLVTLR